MDLGYVRGCRTGATVVSMTGGKKGDGERRETTGDGRRFELARGPGEGDSGCGLPLFCSYSSPEADRFAPAGEGQQLAGQPPCTQTGGLGVGEQLGDRVAAVAAETIEIAEQAVYHDPEHPTHIVLPIIPKT